MQISEPAKQANVAFGLPSEAERAERLGAVLQLLYLIFNEGYTSSSGPQLQRTDLAIVDGIAAGVEDIFPDAMARELGRLWLSHPRQLEAQFAAM